MAEQEMNEQARLQVSVALLELYVLTYVGQVYSEMVG